ncbi:MAG TPA: ABC transporter ATP-binding protein, partial [Candidatus Limnocylindrales bacterium]|nr:ABC transporter ATP-binding protein [Candidatus Limnocylindrales bacterium]
MTTESAPPAPTVAAAPTGAPAAAPSTTAATVAPPADGPPGAIRTRGLTKRFGKVVALDRLDLDIPTGVVFGLLGPNGAGKTTAIRLLAGLARPTAGTALVGGVEVNRRNSLALRRRLGVLDQDPRFYGWMTGRDLLGFVGDLLGLGGKELRTRVTETLDIVGLTDAANRRISGYSGGMRQRLGIGQAIIGHPGLLILDEPVSSLDPEGRRDLLALIGRLRATATVVFSTHVLSDVERICDRIAILDAGRLVTEGRLGDLLGRYAPPIYLIDADPQQDEVLAALAGRLAAESWVAETTLTGSRLRVAVSDDERAARELLPIVVAVGVRIAAFSRERPTLEDVFLRLVGRDREGAGDRGS